MPRPGSGELLVCHDACGLCFSDYKVLPAGQKHPRVYRDIRVDPAVLGHEVTVAVVGVGEDLCEQNHVGDRFVVQPDIHKDGVGYAYGHELQGGLSQYTVLDARVLDGDGGLSWPNVLIRSGRHRLFAFRAITQRGS